METTKLTYINAKTNSKELYRFKREGEQGWSDLYFERELFGDEVPERLEVTIKAVQPKAGKAHETNAPKAEKKPRKPRSKPAAPEVPAVVPLQNITQMSDQEQSSYFMTLANEEG